jgi:hypothetical protein
LLFVGSGETEHIPAVILKKTSIICSWRVYSYNPAAINPTILRIQTIVSRSCLHTTQK